MAQIICEVSKGLRAAEATVMVKDYHGRRHYLPIDRGMINDKQGQHYLPVGVIFLSEKRDAALVEFPLEADSGYNRVWVKIEHLLLSTEVAP